MEFDKSGNVKSKTIIPDPVLPQGSDERLETEKRELQDELMSEEEKFTRQFYERKFNKEARVQQAQLGLTTNETTEEDDSSRKR